MWPRNDEERKKSRNFGFVSFQERKDALSAMNLAQSTGGLLHNRTKLTVQWGKKLPAPGVGADGIIGNQPPSVKRPEDLQQKKVIDLLAKYVAKNGEAFERVIEHSLTHSLTRSISCDEYAMPMMCTD